MKARTLRRYVGRTLVVHQAVGPSFGGVLIAAYRDSVVLGHARHLDDKADLQGEVVVPLGPGVWFQLTVPELTS